MDELEGLKLKRLVVVSLSMSTISSKSTFCRTAWDFFTIAPVSFYAVRNSSHLDSAKVGFIWLDTARMEDIEKLEYLSLVSKVCTEMENHLGFSDKDLGNGRTLNALFRTYAMLIFGHSS